MTDAQFTEICRLTLELTRLRQEGCRTLCVENVAPDLLRKLLLVARDAPPSDERETARSMRAYYVQLVARANNGAAQGKTSGEFQ
jgi:hypothetical protein